MRKNICKVMFLGLVLMGLVLSLPIKAEAQTLQPRLLWEKTVPFKMGGTKMASISGDVIFISRNEIILYDKNGNEVFHWGPRVDREPMGVDISADGSVILYTTTFTENYLMQKKRPGEWDKRIHYATRKGKELWNKKIGGGGELSPDGKMIVVFPAAGEGEDLTMLDSQGKLLWTFKANDIEAFVFSPDNQYLGFQSDGYYLMDKLGNVLWKKTDFYVEDSSISDMAKYVALSSGRDEKRVDQVFDKQGNLVFEGKARVSGDGKRLLVVYPDKHSILSLPDKTVLGEYSGGGFLSHDGRFLSTRTSYPSGDFRVIDTLEQVSKDVPISMMSVSSLKSTKDGRYLLFVVANRKILYYQLY